jgi:hypothetical protein
VSQGVGGWRGPSADSRWPVIYPTRFLEAEDLADNFLFGVSGVVSTWRNWKLTEIVFNDLPAGQTAPSCDLRLIHGA